MTPCSCCKRDNPKARRRSRSKRSELVQAARLTVMRQIARAGAGHLLQIRHPSGAISEGGRIANFSSSTAGLNLPGYAPYIASKAAVESLAQVFAKELRGRQITLNAVAPGPVASELFVKG